MNPSCGRRLSPTPASYSAFLWWKGPKGRKDEESALGELARQIGLTLHNAKLDSALQASLDEVRRQARELQASRARIVEAG